MHCMIRDKIVLSSPIQVIVNCRDIVVKTTLWKGRLLVLDCGHSTNLKSPYGD